jgi:hypothetical protein
MFNTLSGRLTTMVFAASYGIVLLSSGLLHAATVYALDWADDQVLEQRIEQVRLMVVDGNIDEALLLHEVSENNQAPREMSMRVLDHKLALVMESAEMSTLLPASLFPSAKERPFAEKIKGTIRDTTGATFRVLVGRFPVMKNGQPSEVTLQAATDTTLDAQALTWFRRILAIPKEIRVRWRS